MLGGFRRRAVLRGSDEPVVKDIQRNGFCSESPCSAARDAGFPEGSAAGATFAADGFSRTRRAEAEGGGVGAGETTGEAVTVRGGVGAGVIGKAAPMAAEGGDSGAGRGGSFWAADASSRTSDPSWLV